MIYIGIDPGVNTGVAIWDSAQQKLLQVTSMKILEAMNLIRQHPIAIVYIEDARQRKWFGNSGKEVLQGAGSIKRDCQIWEDFLNDNHNFAYYWVAPKDNRTKLSAAQFKAYTGYTGKTNEHGRDAAMLVFKR